MKQREFTAIYQKRGRGIVAWVEEVPGVNTQGRTLQEAKENLKEALQLIFETNHALAIGKAVDALRESIRIAVPA
ncbi:MAG: type II toxin-antitoxin system HicB family antitoxin [bacterium]|nr:type II toxin-antitoxin system HicB family antitoxin [bacterium]MDZ4285292.1 type II toxin-antitoxin system HicB family antitoxin [Patescibacteria group bacterium]